jgi:hypothetical protein
VNVLVAVIACPNCQDGMEGTWPEPGDQDSGVEASLQECPSCAHRFEAEYPGYSFRTEAG